MEKVGKEFYLPVLESHRNNIYMLGTNPVLANDPGRNSTCTINLLNQVTIELDRLIVHPRNDIYVLALSTRNLFEIFTILSFALFSDENMTRWVNQRAKDETDFLLGLRHISTKDEVTAQVDEAIGRFQKNLEYLGVEQERLIRVEEYSRVANVTEEYKGIFSFLSKFIHPTAWQINDKKKKVESPDLYQIVFTRLNLYIQWIVEKVEGQFQIART